MKLFGSERLSYLTYCLMNHVNLHGEMLSINPMLTRGVEMELDKVKLPIRGDNRCSPDKHLHSRVEILKRGILLRHPHGDKTGILQGN